MKKSKMTTLLAALAVVFSFSFLVSDAAIARGFGPGPGMGGPGHGRYGASALELRTDLYNAQVSVLAEMAGKDQDTIKSKLRYKPLWAVLDEYKVDYSDFNEKTTAKRSEIIKQAVSDGKISQYQADWMLQR